MDHKFGQRGILAMTRRDNLHERQDKRLKPKPD